MSSFIHSFLCGRGVGEPPPGLQFVLTVFKSCNVNVFAEPEWMISSAQASVVFSWNDWAVREVYFGAEAEETARETCSIHRVMSVYI